MSAPSNATSSNWWPSFSWPKLTWLWTLLDALTWTDREGRILFLGLDNAGKTTLLDLLAHGRVTAHLPTKTPNCENLQLEGITIKTIDMGGHEDARRLWKDYMSGVDAVVFVVDAAAPHRFVEAQRELNQLLTDDELQGVPFCIMGNKIDMPTCVSPTVFKKALGVENLTTGAGAPPASVGRPLEVFMTSIAMKNYGNALRWVAQFLNKKK